MSWRVSKSVSGVLQKSSWKSHPNTTKVKLHEHASTRRATNYPPMALRRSGCEQLLSLALKCSFWPLSLLESSTLQAGANSNYVDIDFVWSYLSLIIEKAVSKWYLACPPYNEYCMKIKWILWATSILKKKSSSSRYIPQF